MSSSTGNGLGQRVVWEVGGVDGGEGNKVGWMGGGEGGSCTAWDERGKNTRGLMGETGEGEASLEEGGMELRSGLDGDELGGFVLGGEISGSGGGKSTPVKEEAAVTGAIVGDAPAAGLLSLVRLIGDSADCSCGPRRVDRWRVSLSRAVLCQSSKTKQNQIFP